MSHLVVPAAARRLASQNIVYCLYSEPYRLFFFFFFFFYNQVRLFY